MVELRYLFFVRLTFAVIGRRVLPLLQPSVFLACYVSSVGAGVHVFRLSPGGME